MVAWWDVGRTGDDTFFTFFFWFDLGWASWALRALAKEPLLKDYGILELTAFYLGADVEVTGYKLLRVREGTTRADYISSFWHHDNCGSRLKLFVFLQDVGGLPAR